MDVKGLPIDVLQSVLWQLLEQLGLPNPGDYIQLAGGKVGESRKVLQKADEILAVFESASADGIISWEEIGTFFAAIQELVQLVNDLVSPSVE